MTRKEKKEVKRLRDLRKSYLDKMREAVVYDHLSSYAYWKSCAEEVSNRIYSLTHAGASRRPSAVAVEYLSYHEVKRPPMGLLEG